MFPPSRSPSRRWLETWLPNRCCLCQAPCPAGPAVCRACRLRLPYIEADAVCRFCARPLAPDVEAVFSGLPPRQFDRTACALCDYERPPIDGLRALFRYQSPVDAWIPQLKFHGGLATARLLGELFVARAKTLQWPMPDRILPLPLHTTRLGERGFEQPLELARPLARGLGLPLDGESLRRVRQTRRQSEMDMEQRQSNLEWAFSASFATIKGNLPSFVAIIDDVFTTGATVGEAALAVRAAGVPRVEAWVMAVTE